MGDCYSVRLRVKLRKSTKANLQNTLRQWMKDKEEEDCVEWNLAEYRRHGIRPDSFAGICKILLAFRQGCASHVVDKEGFDIFRSGFNASYSWYSVMVGAFFRMAWALDEGAQLWVDRDEGIDCYKVAIDECGEAEVWENHRPPREVV